MHDQLPKDLQDTFSSFLNYGRSVKHSLDPVSLTMKAVKYFTCNVASAPMWKKIENMELCPPIKEKVISSYDLNRNVWINVYARWTGVLFMLTELFLVV